jgi:hypothetical protein
MWVSRCCKEINLSSPCSLEICPVWVTEKGNNRGRVISSEESFFVVCKVCHSRVYDASCQWKYAQLVWSAIADRHYSESIDGAEASSVAQN